jgi:hypothetical protein
MKKDKECRSTVSRAYFALHKNFENSLKCRGKNMQDLLDGKRLLREASGDSLMNTNPALLRFILLYCIPS